MVGDGSTARKKRGESYARVPFQSLLATPGLFRKNASMVMLVLPSQPIHEYQRSFGSELDSADQGPPEGEILVAVPVA